MSVTLFPAVNPIRTETGNTFSMVAGRLVEKDGLYKYIIYGRHRRAVVLTLSKLPGMKLDWARDNI